MFPNKLILILSVVQKVANWTNTAWKLNIIIRKSYNKKKACNSRNFQHL